MTQVKCLVTSIFQRTRAVQLPVHVVGREQPEVGDRVFRVLLATNHSSRRRLCGFSTSWFGRAIDCERRWSSSDVTVSTRQRDISTVVAITVRAHSRLWLRGNIDCVVVLRFVAIPSARR